MGIQSLSRLQDAFPVLPDLFVVHSTPVQPSSDAHIPAGGLDHCMQLAQLSSVGLASCAQITCNARSTREKLFRIQGLTRSAMCWEGRAWK